MWTMFKIFDLSHLLWPVFKGQGHCKVKGHFYYFGYCTNIFFSILIKLGMERVYTMAIPYMTLKSRSSQGQRSYNFFGDCAHTVQPIFTKLAMVQV